MEIPLDRGCKGLKKATKNTISINYFAIYTSISGDELISDMGLFLSSKLSLYLYWSALTIILIALVAPFTIDTVPPLLDYPIYIARSYIVMEHSDNPILQQMFDVDWRPLPNLASDLVLYWLSSLLKIEDAGRVLAGFCVVATFSGVIFLHRINFGYWGWWPFLAALPAYHGAFAAGFINYSIGLALLPFALGFSILARHHGIYLRLFADLVSALILFFCHAISVGLFGVFLLGINCIKIIHRNDKSKMDKQIVKQCFFMIIPFVIPATLYFIFTLTEVVYREDRLFFGEWKLLPKLRGIIMPVLSGNYVLDIILFVFLFAILTYLSLRGKLTAAYGFFLGILIVILFFIILPGHLLDAAFIMDRLPIASVLILIAATNPVALEKQHAVMIVMLLVTLVIARGGILFGNWTESDRYLQQLTRAVANVEPGSSVLIVSPLAHIAGKSLRRWHEIRTTQPDWHFALGNIPTLHSLPAMPLIRRSAFCQLHFVWSDKQILSLAKEFQHLDYGDGGASAWAPDEIFVHIERSNFQLAEETKYFDYILIVYANHIAPAVRKKIREQSPVYIDNEIILLSIPPKISWRAKNLQNTFSE